MKKQLLIIPFILFVLILSTFFYLLITERNPSELPSNLLDKNVPNFDTKSLLKNENFVSKFGTLLSNKLDGSSEGFLSVIKR